MGQSSFSAVRAAHTATRKKSRSRTPQASVYSAAMLVLASNRAGISSFSLIPKMGLAKRSRSLASLLAINAHHNYDGDQTLSFGQYLTAAPFPTPWA